MNTESNLANFYKSLGLAEHDLWRVLNKVNSELMLVHDRQTRELWEGLRDTLRSVINERVRPKLRSLKISDLPDELLICIFEYVNGYRGFDFRVGKVSKVKDVRLTCRRFHEMSSHLLLYYVNVRLTRQSLAHLDEVSRHPSVSKGVRAVRLFLDPHYGSVLAGDIRTYAAYGASKLRDSIIIWEIASPSMIPCDSMPADIYGGAITKAVSLAESWEEAADQGIDATRVDHLTLARAHAEYCQRYEDHKSLCDSLAQAIGSAMMRMPTTTSVQIGGRNIHGPDSWVARDFYPSDLDEPDSMLEKLLPPLNWGDALKHELGPPPFNLIGDLLFSLQRFGITLKRLAIQTPPPTSGLSNALPMLNETGLRTAVEQLEAITFCASTMETDAYWTERAADEWTPFIRFLSCLLHTKSLREIGLNFYFMSLDNPPPLLSMAPILLSYTWPNLKTLDFTGSFHLEELQAVVQRLNKNVRLHWSGYLMSGSWAEVLDFLKEHGLRQPKVGGLLGSIYGQECDEMTKEERDFIFSAYLKKKGSKATQYIRNLYWQRSNPVRDWRMGTLKIQERLVEDE